ADLHQAAPGSGAVCQGTPEGARRQIPAGVSQPDAGATGGRDPVAGRSGPTAAKGPTIGADPQGPEVAAAGGRAASREDQLTSVQPDRIAITTPAPVSSVAG